MATDARYQTYDVSNPATQRTSNTGTIILALFIILALGAGGYYFYANHSNAVTANTAKDTAASVADTIVSVPSSSNMKSTVTTTQPPVKNKEKGADSAMANASSSSANASGFRFVLSRTMNSGYARKRYIQLKTYGTQVYIDSVKKDSYSIYKIYLLKEASTSDTARLKDSLSRYYGKTVNVETAQ